MPQLKHKQKSSFQIYKSLRGSPWLCLHVGKSRVKRTTLMCFCTYVTCVALEIIRRSHIAYNHGNYLTLKISNRKSLFRGEMRFFSEFSHLIHKPLKRWLHGGVARKSQWTVLKSPVLAFILVTNSPRGIRKSLLSPPRGIWNRRRQKQSSKGSDDVAYFKATENGLAVRSRINNAHTTYHGSCGPDASVTHLVC